jgi:hypothetical protein
MDFAYGVPAAPRLGIRMFFEAQVSSRIYDRG